MSKTAQVVLSLVLLALPFSGRGGESPGVPKTEPAKHGPGAHAIGEKASTVDGRNRAIEKLIQQISVSGQVLELSANSSERLKAPARIAPGLPPLLGFRYFQGADRMRFGKLDLVVDDAGH